MGAALIAVGVTSIERVGSATVISLGAVVALVSQPIAGSYSNMVIFHRREL
jgi:hypothetical protein